MEQHAENNVFRQESLDRITSPDDLNDYIRVYRPSVWLLIAAAALLIAGFLVWSALGYLPTTVPIVCVAEEGKLTGYVEDVTEITAGLPVKIGDAEGRVRSVAKLPLSSEEVSKRYDSDYTIHLLGIQDWNYEIIITAANVPDGLVEGTIVTDSVHPIQFIFG